MACPSGEIKSQDVFLPFPNEVGIRVETDPLPRSLPGGKRTRIWRGIPPKDNIKIDKTYK